jgi:hypothetical protein
MVTRRRHSTSTIAGVAITHPDRVIAQAPELTKLDIVRYYDSVAEVMLPHLRDRPLTLVQCAPDIAHCRYLRHSGASRPPSQIRIVKIREQTKIGDYMVVDNAAGLIALAQRNILEFHTWNSTTRRLETPNRIVLDLDPGPSVSWRVVVDAARQVRALLRDLGLQSWLNDEEIDRPSCERLEELGLRELFRCGEDELGSPIVDVDSRALGFGGRHRAVHLHGADPERGELVPLISGLTTTIVPGSKRAGSW